MEAPLNFEVVDKRRRQQRMVRPAWALRHINTLILQGVALAGQHALDGAGAGYGKADVQDEVALHAPSIRPLRAPPEPHTVPRWGDRRAIGIGLLGGSFNPAHAGHLHIARVAMRRLRLAQIWLLVSPGNPLKDGAGMAPFADRLASASAIADGRRIVATGIERQLGTQFTRDTLRVLHTSFPRAKFVWLMGADNLEQIPRWHGWMELARETQIAVLPRPTYNHRALSGQAARRWHRWRIQPHGAAALAAQPAPRWLFLAARENALSATKLRERQKTVPGDTK